MSSTAALAPLGQVIGIRCCIEGGAVADVEIEPRRPPPVERLLLGKPAAAVAPVLDVVFSVCRHAHGLAARQALAQDSPLPVDELSRLAFLRDLEMAREHGLNLLQSLPADPAAPGIARELLASVQALSGLARGFWPGDAAAALTPLQAALQVFFDRFWFLAEAPLDEVLAWAERSDAPAARLLARLGEPGWADFGACVVPSLPSLSVEKLASLWAVSGVDVSVGSPAWNGIPCESTCYARQAGHPLVAEAARRHGSGLLARSLARMVELVQLVKALGVSVPRLNRLDPDDPGMGVGFAQVETSRGRLLHRAVLEQGKVASYGILAPTEWNFHPRGLICQGLLGACADCPEELERKTRAFLHAVDPCVRFELQFVF